MFLLSLTLLTPYLISFIKVRLERREESPFCFVIQRVYKDKRKRGNMFVVLERRLMLTQNFCNYPFLLL